MGAVETWMLTRGYKDDGGIGTLILNTAGPDDIEVAEALEQWFEDRLDRD
jgi:hypothetical protein